MIENLEVGVQSPDLVGNIELVCTRVCTFQNFFTFTLLPGSSALLHTPECSEYDPSKHRPVVSALSLTRLQLYGTNTLFLPVMLSLSVLLIYLNLP